MSNWVTKKDICTEIILSKKVEESTDARYNACMDIYNVISFAVVNHAIVPQYQPHLNINYWTIIYTKIITNCSQNNNSSKFIHTYWNVST